MSQVIIQIGTGSDIGDTTLVNDLKDYATKNFSWKEQIPDPDFVATEEDPTAPLIDNPITYIQVIFGDYPLQQFFTWKEEQVRKAAVVDEVQTMKDNVVLSVTE